MTESKDKIRSFLGRYRTHIEIAFIITQLLLLCLTLFVRKIENIASFSIVILCFIFALIFLKGNKRDYLIVFALFFTVISDLFLVILLPKFKMEEFRSVAMVTFSIAQLSYFAYLLKSSFSAHIYRHLIIRLCVCVVAILLPVIVLGKGVNFLAIISVFYYANLITNCVYALVKFKSNPLFALGLSFFILCDTFVGVQVGHDLNMLNFGADTLIYKIFFADFNFIWLFYTISQCLIVLSLNHLNSSADEFMREKL